MIIFSVLKNSELEGSKTPNATLEIVDIYQEYYNSTPKGNVSF